MFSQFYPVKCGLCDYFTARKGDMSKHLRKSCPGLHTGRRGRGPSKSKGVTKSKSSPRRSSRVITPPAIIPEVTPPQPNVDSETPENMPEEPFPAFYPETAEEMPFPYFDPEILYDEYEETESYWDLLSASPLPIDHGVFEIMERADLEEILSFIDFSSSSVLGSD